MGVSRRDFLKFGVASLAVASSARSVFASMRQQQPLPGETPMTAITLPELPYAKDALEPHISARTLEFHHGKHHNAYVVKTNELIAGTELEGKPLEEIVRAAWEKKDQPLFNNAAQVWNHTFFWHSMTPSNGGGKPTGALAAQIEKDFGSYEKFAEAFKAAGVGQFGSGWAWLVADSAGKLSITKTPNAELPQITGNTPILTCDVWEHAYYLDYQNRRPDFLQTFLDKLVNWDFAASNYEAVASKKAA